MSMEDLKKLLPQNNVVNFTPKGYSKQREFYAPKYTAAAATYTRNDLRSTIYWNPKVVTDPVTGTSTFEFYNSDGKGSFKAIVEGFDKNGNIGRTVIRYTVK